MGALLAKLTRDGTLRQVRHVTPVRPAAATGLVAQVYQQVERDFGMLAPPISLHSPAPECLAAAWSILRESLLATGVTSRQTREVVAAAVSAANDCPYCVDVHGTTLVGLGGDEFDAVGGGRPELLRDPYLRAVATWAHTGAAPSPLPADQVPELVAVAVAFHYLNRMVNVFLPDSPLPPALPRRAQAAARRMTAQVLGRLARRPVHPGLSGPLLPAAPPPEDLTWAQGHDTIVHAYAAAAHAVDAAPVPDAVRERVLRLAGDLRAEPGLSMGRWLAESVTSLPADHRPLARLVLLIMLASYRVTPLLIDEVRRTGLDDADLVRVASWASLHAARAAGTRLAAAAAGEAQPDLTEAGELQGDLAG